MFPLPKKKKPHHEQKHIKGDIRWGEEEREWERKKEGEGGRRGEGERAGEGERKGRTGKPKGRFRSLLWKKMQSELKTHDEEIASMKQEHWTEMQEIWEEMVR